jgi:hypothetical protein
MRDDAAEAGVSDGLSDDIIIKLLGVVQSHVGVWVRDITAAKRRPAIRAAASRSSLSFPYPSIVCFPH